MSCPQLISTASPIGEPVVEVHGDADAGPLEGGALLARMARFVVADLTDPASIPQELQAIAPGVKVPIRLIIQKGERPYAMARDLLENYWVLPPFRYSDLQHLLAHLDGDVIAPAEDCRREIARRREAAAGGL